MGRDRYGEKVLGFSLRNVDSRGKKKTCWDPYLRFLVSRKVRANPSLVVPKGLGISKLQQDMHSNSFAFDSDKSSDFKSCWEINFLGKVHREFGAGFCEGFHGFS